MKLHRVDTHNEHRLVAMVRPSTFTAPLSMITRVTSFHCRKIARFAVTAALFGFLPGCAPVLTPHPPSLAERGPSEQSLTVQPQWRETSGQKIKPDSGQDTPEIADLIRKDTLSPVEIRPASSTQPIESAEQSIDQIVAYAELHHPRVQAALQEIDIARAAVLTASAQDNPNLVVDVQTPVYDHDDPTELTTRLTFPVGRRREIRLRRLVAASAVAKAEADYQATLREIGAAARQAALDVAYLQHRYDLDVQDEQLSLRRAGALAPDQVDGDPAENFVRHVDAKWEAQRATAQRLKTQRELAIARADLASAMGLPETEPSLVSFDFDSFSLDLPSLQDVMVDAERHSAAVEVAMADFDQSRRQYELQRGIGVDKEMGPRYQDRLGEDDDSIGVRFQTDIPLYDPQRGPIAEAAAETRRQSTQVKLARHQVRDRIKRDYRELESLAKELRRYRGGAFVTEQHKMLETARDQQLMTAAQMLRIELAIVDHRRQQLQLEYRFALLRSRIDASPAEGKWTRVDHQSLQ